MSDQTLTIAMMVVFGALALGMSVLTTWFLVTHRKRLRGIQDRGAEIVAREEYALQRLATLLRAPYTPGRMVDIPGVAWPVAGTVDCRCRHLQVRVTFRVDNNIADEGPGESWFLPLVAIDVPQGARWVVEPKGRLLTKSIYGDEVRKQVTSSRGADFQRAFGVREDALPPSASALLWWVGERSHKIEFSWRGVEIFPWPSDIVAHNRASFLETTVWEGGYDPNELAAFVDQACALVASLLVPAVSRGAFGAGG